MSGKVPNTTVEYLCQTLENMESEWIDGIRHRRRHDAIESYLFTLKHYPPHAVRIIKETVVRELILPELNKE